MDVMKNLQIALPFWVRAILLVGVVCILAGAGLISYRYYTRPRRHDDRSRRFARWQRPKLAGVASIASRLATTDSPVRLKVENAGSVLDAAKAFNAGTADLAVVRADVGDLQQARAVALTAHGVVMIVAPPGSSITSIAKLRDHAVGVVGGEINRGVVEALTEGI